MSIDGIRMGRISKAEKLKSLKDQNQISIYNKDIEIICENNNDYTTPNLAIDAILLTNNLKTNYDSNLFLPKEFKYWYNGQLEIVNKNKENIILNSDDKKFPITTNNSNLELNDELVVITMLKDKAFQVYKIHIKTSYLINNSRERLKNKDYIDSNAENVSVDDLLIGLVGSIADYAKWFTRFALELPGFNKLNRDDFMKIVANGTPLTIGLQINEFFNGGDLHQITQNGYEMSRNRMNSIFGYLKTCLILLMHSKLKELCFSEHELALLYPFILFTCNENLLQDKEKYFKLRMIYNKALLYEFILNGRDEAFFKKLNELFEHFSVLQINKETICEKTTKKNQL